MKYTGSFKDVNDKLFTIDIITNNDSTTSKSITFGDTPIITEIEGNDNLFKPVKYSSATIKILTKELLSDMYTSLAQGTKVILSEGSTVRWVGYLTPNMYNQGFEYDLEELELEAIDGLSTLQYIDYSTPKKDFKRFTTLITNILSKCNCYQYFYLPYTYQIDDKTTDYFFSKLEVSEANFFDEDNEPMKCDEVLQELCKFMGVTAVAYGSNVYFLDYDAITLDYKDYYRYKVGEEVPQDSVVRNVRTISASSYAENGTQLSLGNTYSKVSVKDSLYSVDRFIPDIDDNKYLINRNGAEYYETKINEYGEPDDPERINALAYSKFYDHKFFQSHYYDPVTLNPTDFIPKSHEDLKKCVGATIMRNYTHTIKPAQPIVDQDPLRSLEFKPYILVNNLNKSDGKIRSLLDFNIPNPLVFGGDKTFLVINGSAIFNNNMKFDTCTDYEGDQDDKINNEYLNLYFMLKCGKYYFDGSQWVTNKTFFLVPLGKHIKTDEDPNISIYHTEYKIKDNINYLEGLKVSSGYSLQLPKEVIKSNEIQLSVILPIYNPIGDFDVNKFSAYWIGDFDVSIEVANKKYDQDDKTDTEYSNVNNEDYVNDFKGEEFKICTWDSKESNYSAVLYFNGEHYIYLDKIYNKATKKYMRSEEHFINRILDQYSEAPYILDLTTQNDVKPYSVFTTKLFGGLRRLVVDSQSIDWRLNTNNVKLIEKK